MTRSLLAWTMVTGMLLGTLAALSVLPRDVREVPLGAPLETIPIDVQGWSGSNHVPADVLPVDPNVPVHLWRTYRNGTQTVWVSVGYYPYQGEGRRPPAQQLLYPSHGWTELNARPLRITLDSTGQRSMPVNQIVMRIGGRWVAILYWYQVGLRSIASDHWYRALLVYNRVVHRRADGALVRIASPVPEASNAASVLADQERFIHVFYRELLRRLPR